jgi:hypothetical protein
MRTPEEVCQAVLEWARETVPALQGGYAFIPLQSEQPLPDVVVDLATYGIVREDARFPHRALQQAWIWTWEMELSFMVDNTNPETAAQDLRAWSSALAASLMADGSLGGKVQFISPLFSFDYTAPFVERDDGTRGREMVLRMTVGELVEEAQ